ncbi:MAG: hypothetical protein ACT4OP_04820 [Actinomycetota bacterium]
MEPRRAFLYRLIYLGIGLTALAAIALGAAFGGEGEPAPLPAPLESISPAPHESALAQALIEVDLATGFVAEIFVDGFPIPPSEVSFVEATGVHSWQPHPESVVFSAWTPGTHEVRVVWDTIAGLPQPGEYSWTFRVQ